MEIWKDVLGYEGHYQVSNLGRVKSLERKVNAKEGSERTVKERLLKPSKDRGGYLLVNLSKDGKVKNIYVHRLVAQAFIPNPDNLPEVNHKDENPQNNCADNLEYCDRTYNINYGTRTERTSKPVLCVETGITYLSSMEVQRQLGFAQGNISNCCLGKKHFNTAYGYHWQYVA